MRRSSQQHQMIRRWLNLYDQVFNDYNHPWDQASLRSALWTSITSNQIRLFALPQEFNLRTPRPWVSGRGMPVHIIHGRFKESEFNSFIDYLNSESDRFRHFGEWLESHPDSEIRPQSTNLHKTTHS